MACSLSWYGYLPERGTFQVLVRIVPLVYGNPCLVITLDWKTGGGWLLHFSDFPETFRF